MAIRLRRAGEADRAPDASEARRRAAESVYEYQSAAGGRRLSKRGKAGIVAALCLLTAGAAVGCGFAVHAAQTHLDGRG